jgi:hypothetical protein
MLPLIFVFATERILSLVIAVAPIELATSIPDVLAENKVVPVLERTIKVLSVSVVKLLTINVPAIILS